MGLLLPALIALFVGSAGVPLTFKDLMTQVPKFNAIWAVLHPIHGLILYSVILAAMRLPPKKMRFNPLYAIPISSLFGLYNVMKGTCGKGDGVPGILMHLTDQLEPLVVMALAIPLGQQKGFPKRQWTAAALLLGASIWYIFSDMANSMNIKSPYQLSMCVSKNVPLAGAFLYIEWLLTERFIDLFPTVLWWWICVFQTFTTLAPAYVQFNPEEHGDMNYFTFLTSGIQCYWFGKPAAECSKMPSMNITSIFFGGMMNLAMPVVARHGGAPLLMLVRAVTLPVVAFLFTCPIFVGDRAETLDLNKCLGLTCATASLVLWASAKSKEKQT